MNTNTKVLLAVDGSEFSDAAKVHVVGADSPRKHGSMRLARLAAAAGDSFLFFVCPGRHIRTSVLLVAETSQRAVLALVEGDPLVVTLSRAAEWEADLIVPESRGRTEFE